MKLKLYLLIQLLLGSAVSVSAQDYVIKTSGDTIKGVIVRFDVGLVKIKPDSGKAVKFQAAEVKQFVRGGNLFLSREIYSYNLGSEFRFLELEEKGVVNLLTIRGTSNAPMMMVNPSGGGGMMMMGGGRQRPSYYVEKAGEVTVLHETVAGSFSSAKRIKEVRTILMGVMGDDAALAEKIQTITLFSIKVVQELVKEYNHKHF